MAGSSSEYTVSSFASASEHKIEDLTIPKRLFWIVLVLGMGVALGVVLTLQLLNYYSYPTVIDIHERYLTVYDIPDISICKQETKIFAKYGDFAGVHTESFIVPHPSSDCGTTGYIPGECVLKLARQKELTKLVLAGLENIWHEYSNLTTTTTDMGLCDTFKTSKFIEYTNLFSNTSRKVPLDLLLSVRDRILSTGERQGLQVSLHTPDEPPLPRKSRVQVAVNKSCRVHYKKVTRNSLTTPFQSFIGEQCVDTSLASFKNPLTRYSVYTKDTCLEECFVNFTVAQCGCRYYLHPGFEAMCNYSTMSKCMELARMEFRRYKTECNCPPSCEYTQFETSVSCSEIHSPPFQMIHLEIVSDTDMVTEIKQLPVYSIEGILGSLGGLIGLFMGFSVVSIIEFLELIFIALSFNNMDAPRTLTSAQRFILIRNSLRKTFLEKDLC